MVLSSSGSILFRARAVRLRFLYVKWRATLFAFLILPALGFSQSNFGAQFSEPTRFLAVHGRRAWAGGYANTGMEVWAGALQIASNIRPEFRRAGDVTAIPGESIVNKVEVDPARISITYVGPDFSVEEQVWAERKEPAVLLQYVVHSSHRVQIAVRFRASLNLMWPAATGGQEMRWDSTESGYLLTDPTQQFAAVVLAPNATAHDEPLNSPHESLQRAEMAVDLDPNFPEILFARVKARSSNQSGLEIKDARQLLQSSVWQQENVRHSDEVLSSGLEIDTPDSAVNQALAWAAVALDQAWFCSDDLLDCAYVAGYGPSRRNRRPQYAWFFAGDGMIDLHAALARSELDRVRDEIRFIAKYQDPETGMIWHELSLSAPYVDWRGKYPYMFVHADLTYPYISTIADYVHVSNDRVLLRELWPSVQRAFVYGRSLIDNDGLPRIPESKEGADEQEPLSDELALSASWVTACKDYGHLAELMGEVQAAHEAEQWAEKARASFPRRYWDERRNAPIDAYFRTGDPVTDRGLGAVAAVTENLFSDEQTRQVLNSLASWRFESDWGTRSIAADAPGYDPTGYGHGSVWALQTANVAQAFWDAHRPNVAWEIWRKLLPWSTLDSPGHMHEVLAGDTYHPQQESVPEQTWSSAAFLSAAVRGLFGLDVNGENGTVTVAPHLPPDWHRASLKGVRIGDSKVDITFDQSTERFTAHLQTGGAGVHLLLEPQLPLGARILSVSACGRRSPFRIQTGEEGARLVLDFVAPQGACDVAIRYRGGVGITLLAPHPSLGNPSSGPELTSVAFHEDTLYIGLDVIPSLKNSVRILTKRPVLRATPGTVKRINEYTYEVDTPTKADVSSYQHLQISIALGK
jgi:hypothetical protein